MSNEEIVEQIHQGINVQENMGILYQQNKSFIRSLVIPFTEKAELDDLMQESFFFLVDAVNKYDPSIGAKFLTYATHKIRFGCLEYVKNNGHQKRIPLYMQERIKKYNILIEEYGGVPEKEVVMKKLNLTQKQYDLMKLTLNQMTCVSMDKPLNDDDGDLIIDLIPDETDIEGSVILQDCCETLWKQVDMIGSERQKNIVLKHFREDQKLSDIASEQNVSVQRVQSLERQALRKLKQMDRVKEIAEFFGYDSAIAYSGRKGSVEKIALKHIELESKYNKLKNKLSNILTGL